MRNWVGLHIIPERINRDGLLAMFGRLAKAGRPVPLVTVLNDAGLADDIKRISSATIVIFRVETNTHPQVGEDGGKWLDDRLGLALASKLADYRQFACEDLSDNPAALNNFYVGMGHRAIELGLSITMGNIATGNPPGDIQAGIEAMRPMLQMASDHGFPLVYHPYSPRTAAGFADIGSEAPYYVQRYKFWKAAFPKLIIFGGEAGTGQPDYQPDKTLSFMKRLNELVDIFVAYWSVGWWNMDNGASQIDAILPEYEQMCMQYDEVKVMGGTISLDPQPVTPTYGLADFINDTAQYPADDKWILHRVSGDHPRDYEWTIDELRQGSNNVHPLPATIPPKETILKVTPAVGLRLRSSQSAADESNIVEVLKQGELVTAINYDPKLAWTTIVSPKSGFMATQFLTPTA